METTDHNIGIAVSKVSLVNLIAGFITTSKNGAPETDFKKGNNQLPTT